MWAGMMGMRIVFIAAAIFCVSAIKVPVEKSDENDTQTKTDDAVESPENPNYYESEDDQEDSYGVPPNSEHPLEGISDEIATLATYLLPPSEEKQNDYYKPTEAGEQTDWYPIAPGVSSLPRQLLPPYQEANPALIQVSDSEPYSTIRIGKLADGRARHTQVVIPSRELQPPAEDAPNDYVSDINIAFDNIRPARPDDHPFSVWKGPAIAVPNNIRTKSFAPPPHVPKKNKNPTKLYPKKYVGAFKPIPIPVNQYNEGQFIETQKVKPLKVIRPNENTGNEYRGQSKDKTIQKFEEAQKKRVLKRRPEKVEVEELEASESQEDTPSLEQDTSASHYREPLRRPYPAQLRQAPKPAPQQHSNQAQSHAPPADGERTEFRMHGMKGPHSYQFGFDTGKGKNRQFRYEERDNDGHVKGHYGYMDKNGKLRVVNYDADPEHGFRAEPPVEAK